MPPPELPAITTTTPALQQVLRLLPRNPYAVALVLPRDRAERAARRVLERYPSTTAPRNTRSALRSLGLPAVTALLLPPDQDAVTLLLLASAPPDDREAWRLAADPLHPLMWRSYEVSSVHSLALEADHLRAPQQARSTDRARLTWRLAQPTRSVYRQQVTRIIHSTRPRQGAQRDGGPRAGTTRTPTGQRAALDALGRHLHRYPGLHGVRQDCWMLHMHLRRLWRQQHPALTPPDWGRFPYCDREPVQYAPLHTLWPLQEIPTP